MKITICVALVNMKKETADQHLEKGDCESSKVEENGKDNEKK